AGRMPGEARNRRRAEAARPTASDVDPTTGSSRHPGSRRGSWTGSAPPPGGRRPVVGRQATSDELLDVSNVLGGGSRPQRGIRGTGQPLPERRRGEEEQ